MRMTQFSPGIEHAHSCRKLEILGSTPVGGRLSIDELVADDDGIGGAGAFSLPLKDLKNPVCLTSRPKAVDRVLLLPSATLTPELEFAFWELDAWDDEVEDDAVLLNCNWAVAGWKLNLFL